jgi:hypothetical protein
MRESLNGKTQRREGFSRVAETAIEDRERWMNADPTIGQQAVIVDIYLPTMCFADFSSGLFADGGRPNEDDVAQAERLTIDAIGALTKAGVKVYAASAGLRAKPMAKITAACPCTAFEPTR